METSKLHNGDLIYGLYQNEEDETVYKTVCKFLGYDPFNKFLWVDSKDGIEEFITFEPIPLSEEILLKCGFELYPWGFVKEDCPLIRFNFKPLFFWVEMGNGFRIELLYLHTLQNLIQLTGTDLEINL